MGGPFMSTLCFLTPHSFLLSYRLLKPTPPSSFIMAVCESNKSSFQWWWKNQIQVLFGEFVTHVWFGTCLSVFCSSYCTNNLETLLLETVLFDFQSWMKKILWIKSDHFLSLMLWEVFYVFIDSLFLCIKTYAHQ